MSESEMLPETLPATPINDEDRAELSRAVSSLEGSNLAQRLGALVGRQIDLAAQVVPAPILDTVNRATLSALNFALKMAIRSLKGRRVLRATDRFHVALAAASGAAGGAFGLAALPVELPVSTTIMLRSIADIARTEGEDLDDPETLLACLEVFALGSGSEKGPAGESGYLAVRSLLAKSVSEAARYMVQRGLADEGAPALVRLLGQIAARFGVVVGQKTMAQALPVLGAVAGAAVNAAFTDHFQTLAHAHFTVRRLERRYGEAAVHALFEETSQRLRAETPDRKRTYPHLLVGSTADR